MEEFNDFKTTRSQIDLETMIAEEILANNGVLGFDTNDIQHFKDSSDFIDGTAVEGKLDDMKELAEKAIGQIRDANSDKQLVNIILKIRVAAGVELTMEQMGALNSYFSEMDEGITNMWSMESDASLSNEIRLCILCGFKVI